MTMNTQFSAAAQTGLPALVGPLSNAIRQSRVLIVLTLLHLAAALCIAAWYRVPLGFGVAMHLFTILRYVIPAFLIFLMFWRFGYMALIVRPARPSHWFLSDARTFCLDPERLAIGLIAFLTINMFLTDYSFLKEILPHLNTYSWDPALARADRWLHGGIDPYLLLGPLLDTPIATTWVNAAYHFWFFLFYFVMFMACFDRDNHIRGNTFLIGSVLVWAIGGNLLATIFASGGPVYYQALGYGDTFVPLMEKLHRFAEISPIWALDVQNMLLDGYLNDGPVKGISAMPSMHLASTALMACHAFAWRRWAGWLMVPFTLIILMGSVHLGWHYAIDGYLGILAGVAGWYGARPIARAFHSD
ncbi:inositol phosphorylceramide synthase [Pelagivirga sediminicola]|uniref:Inositol phosphorylceramide synthase n=1 Tax=Pelagivirga sediminicola TaxID=2170575 RepID=A0A2T7GA92_9RHOB|nr:phosphatase PAP2 family protein [Pelagivirga sediminicola]PVA11316.1 inositol phosphorylceramide synthase [Pelagivirga sediminicola]